MKAAFFDLTNMRNENVLLPVREMSVPAEKQKCDVNCLKKHGRKLLRTLHTFWHSSASYWQLFLRLRQKNGNICLFGTERRVISLLRENSQFIPDALEQYAIEEKSMHIQINALSLFINNYFIQLAIFNFMIFFYNSLFNNTYIHIIWHCQRRSLNSNPAFYSL